MSGCFAWLMLVAGGVLVMASLLRWFEQTGDAIDQGDWQRLMLLIVFPFSVWSYPSRVAAGRPTAVPHHEPVRGFGKVPVMPSDAPSTTSSADRARIKGEDMAAEAAKPMTESSDQPPPGTPAEFLGMPKIPPKKPKAAIDPEKLAKLRQKMKDQGMLEE